MRTITLDPALARNYEPPFKAAVVAQPDDDYRIVMEFFIDGAVSETWTWTPAMTGYVEQAMEGTVKRLQITWARKSSVTLLKVWCEESADGPRWVARWATNAGDVEDQVLDATDAQAAEEEAEDFIFRMAYL